MNRFLMVLTLCVSVSTLSGCLWFQSGGDGGASIPYNLTTADQAHYNTVGLDFKDYYEQDADLNQGLLSMYDAALIEWLKGGSNWETFVMVVGSEMDGPYFIYVESDEKLTEADKEARYLNVAAWELNIESRNGPLDTFEFFQ